MESTQLHAISRIRIGTDGDGVTTLVTFPGCPLRCGLCINADTWDGSREFETVSVKELYDRIKLDSLYFQTTGGGVMFGGGEPMLRADFISEFARTYSKLRWNFYMETSLSVPWEYIEKVIPYISYFFVDTKDMDEERYSLYTKGDYQLFISNLNKLIDAVGADRIRVRVPVIPNLHKTYESAVSNANRLKEMGFTDIEIFNYEQPQLRKSVSDAAIGRMSEFISDCEKYHGLNSPE